ncbi:MAG: tRNA epoxyqueuosine(34) reductase QueG [Bacteroidota bacterium]|nr:tRNA epoxyqueuosine(34) reductase QueG [Bacteroidota bacterium]
MIKAEATRLGFSACGISKAGFLEEEAPRLESYLKNNYQGKMHYLENHFDKRLDPTLLVEGAKSVVSLVFNYYPSETQKHSNAPKLSKYAYGTDYHFVLKDKLKQLLKFIKENIGEVNGRVFVDSAPVLERAWAKKSGLGWIGKNGILIMPKAGSFFFIAELIIDLELEPDLPIKDYCGSCTKCIDACPTGAIIEPKVVDGSRCISYFTIELKDEIPSEMKGKFDNWVFGCDICQDVCPWNRFSITHNEPAFVPNPEIIEMTKQEWQEITRETFGKIFKNSTVNRTKFSGLKRNLRFLEHPISNLRLMIDN